MRMFQVYGHRQLCAKNGDLVASSGEKVPADHPAVLALTDPTSVGRFVEDAPPEVEIDPILHGDLEEEDAAEDDEED